MLRVALVLSASASVPCKVIVTTPEEADAVAPPDPLKPVNRVMAGVPEIVNDEGNVTVIVLPLTKAPAAPALNPPVQVVPVAPGAWEDPTMVIADADVAADAGRASRVNPRPPVSKPSTRAIGTSLLGRRTVPDSMVSSPSVGRMSLLANRRRSVIL